MYTSDITFFRIAMVDKVGKVRRDVLECVSLEKVHQALAGDKVLSCNPLPSTPFAIFGTEVAHTLWSVPIATYLQNASPASHDSTPSSWEQWRANSRQEKLVRY